MSLYVLDTDILSLYQHAHSVVCQNVTNHPHNEIAITVITVQEQLFGWYHLLGQTKKPDQLAIVYQSLAETLQFLARWPILSFSEPAILRFEQLLTMKLNIGKMDLRIAAIALQLGHTVVTRNTRDFRRVPGLSIEDWTV